MKTVFQNHSEVCSVWASRKQEHGRSGNIDFCEDTIYSYGHYAIGKLYPDKKIALFEQDTYSISTAGHISCAECAALDYTYKTMRVYDIDGDHEENIKWFLDQLRDTVNKFNSAIGWRARWRLNENHDIHDKLKRYCSAFELKMPVTLGLYLDPEYPFIKKRFLRVNENTELFLPRWLANKGIENIEPKDILKTRNAEIRREIIRRLGIERICHALKAKTIDKQGEYELILLDLKDGRRRPFLKMHNPSVPEIWHVEGIHPALKTVQDALNYRRYGDDMFIQPQEFSDSWRAQRDYANNPEQWIIKTEYQTSPLFPSDKNWNPEKLT